MVTPENLKAGDKVAIICTARFAIKEHLEDGINLLKKWNLEPVLGSSIGLIHHQFGGLDNQRTKDLQSQIDNPEIKAIWCAKGGYGTTRLIDDINFEALLSQHKWIIGYSDITALHLHLQNMGLSSLHAQMPVDIQNKSVETIESLEHTLFQEPYNIHYKPVFPSRSGFAHAEIIGGNLSVIYSVLGTSSEPDFSGKILFIEDIGEFLYHIDRMMHNLFRRGILHKIEGLIVGSMTEMDDNTIPFGLDAYQIINQYVSHLEIPIAFDCPVGHDFHNLALTLGVKTKFTVTDNLVSIEY